MRRKAKQRQARGWLPLLMGLAVISSSCVIQKKAPIRLSRDLHEISGIVYTEGDTLWGHNDGGNPPVVYRLHLKRGVLDSLSDPSLDNEDLESMARDDSQYVYVGDMGNNTGREKNYKIYKVHKRSFRVEAIHISFPNHKDRTPWPNIEAMFWARDSLWVFTKSAVDRQPFYSDVYAISDAPGVQRARWKGRIFPQNFVITGAAIDRTNGQIALVGYRLKKFLGIPRLPAKLWLLNNKQDAPFWMDKGTLYSLSPWGIGKPIEAVDFIEPGRMIIGSEKSPIHKAQIQEIRQRGKY